MQSAPVLHGSCSYWKGHVCVVIAIAWHCLRIHSQGNIINMPFLVDFGGCSGYWFQYSFAYILLACDEAGSSDEGGSR